MKDSCSIQNMWNTLWNDSNGYASEYLRRTVSFRKIELIRIANGLDFSPGELLLDAGCGNGHAVMLMAQLFGLECYAVDISTDALQDATTYCGQNGLAVNFVCSDVRTLPFLDATFEYVLSFGVIEHFSDPGLPVREIYRVLRPGGWALFVQPNKFSEAPISRLVLKALGKWRFGSQVEFTPSQMKQILREAEFREIRLFVDDLGRGTFLGGLLKHVSPQWGWYIFCLGRK
jgi:ubiquinone/menaquinone biosynthesis C-methylase UbiE